MNQINLFWHHTFCFGANCWLYFGMPEQTTIGQGGGSLGEFTLGHVHRADFRKLALYANGSYMRPTAAAGFVDLEMPTRSASA